MATHNYKRKSYVFQFFLHEWLGRINQRFPHGDQKKKSPHNIKCIFFFPSSPWEHLNNKTDVTDTLTYTLPPWQHLTKSRLQSTDRKDERNTHTHIQANEWGVCEENQEWLPYYHHKPEQTLAQILWHFRHHSASAHCSVFIYGITFACAQEN